MSTALTTRQQQEVRELLTHTPDALVAFGEEFLKPENLRFFPARIKIAHKDDDDIGVKAGEFFNAKTNVVYGKSVEFIFLFFARMTRAEYKFPFEKDVPLLCGSDDGDNPRESTERRPLTRPMPGPCDACDRAKWEDADGIKRQKPPCSEQHNFMINVKTGENMWDKGVVTLQKSRVPAADVLRELCLGVSITQYIFATTKMTEGKSGDYYMPLFTYGPRLTAPQIEDIKTIRAGAFRSYELGEMHIGADEGDDDPGNGGTDPHAPTAEEKKMPWDDDPDVVAPEQPQAPPAAQSVDQPPMPEPPPFTPDF